MEQLFLNTKEDVGDEAIITKSTFRLGNKRDIAKMLNVSKRSVDNYIAGGCPVIKLSPRCCRFDLAEVMAWFKEQYGQQTRKKQTLN